MNNQLGQTAIGDAVVIAIGNAVLDAGAARDSRLSG